MVCEGMKISIEDLSIETKEGRMAAFLACPELSGKKYPVVIVFQEAFGVNSHIRSICQRLAQAGYLAIAPELFHRKGLHVEFDYSDVKSAMPLLNVLTKENLIEDIHATFQFVGQHPLADNSFVATIGFCMGGYTSILAATQANLTAAVSFYGAGLIHPRPQIGFGPLVSSFKDIHCSLLLFFGDEDTSIPLTEIDEISKSLKELKKDHEIVVFEKSKHGFFCEERKSYNRQSASEAWGKMLAWFDHLLAGKNNK